MKKEDIQNVLAAIGKSGITVNGDLVLEKNVQYEVANVENGGIGIQLQQRTEAAEASPAEISKEQLARAIENCQPYFWGNSAYAVLYCLMRDDLGKDIPQSRFEQMIEMLPYKTERGYKCNAGTIANAFSNNAYLKMSVDRWQQNGAHSRSLTLLKKLREELKLQK